MNPEDIFAHFFGGGFGGHRQRPSGPRRGKDMVHPVNVGLEDVYRGKVVKLALQKHVICSKCDGKGGKDVTTCGPCKGQGVRTTLRQMGPMLQQSQSVCDNCNGTGEFIKDKCKNCNGKKVISDKKVLEVHIDKGMKNGQKIVFSGEGDQSPGVVPGDVIVVIQEKPHSFFARKGDDLFCKVQLDLLTALAGGEFCINHLDERVIRCPIKAGQVINPGDFKKIKGEGMPAYKRPFDKGYLYVEFEVIFPNANWTSLEKIKQLESILPARKLIDLKGINPEMINAVDLENCKDKPKPTSNGQGHAQDEDMEDEGHGGHSGVQCAQQ
jgi:DnaJ family protein A protein 2